MSHKFADLHCHPHMRSFNWLHKGNRSVSNTKYHPWWIIFPKKRSQDKGRRAAAYSQSDLAKLQNGNVRLAFAALYPMEKGWVTGRNNMIKEKVVDFSKLIGNNKFNNILSTTLGTIIKPILAVVGNDHKDDPAIRDLLQAIYMKLPYKRINFFQSNKYDYYKELISEKEYIKKKNGVQTKTDIYIPFLKRIFINKRRIRSKFSQSLNAQGQYIIAKNGQHIKDIIKDDLTAFVMTIEGANVFNTKEEFSSIKENILKIKFDKDCPIFFITFCHHFNNYLAGHAHSIPNIGKLLLDQEEGMFSGITDKGFKVLNLLLSIDEEDEMNTSDLGARILIDVKHMNAISRKDYYEKIVNPRRLKGDYIPIIASHVAFSGKKNLQSLIDDMHVEKDDLYTKINEHQFNAWNINLCDEDVIEVFKSEGLIGINLDQRVLAIKKEDKKKKDTTHAKYVWQNIKGMMGAVLNSGQTYNIPQDYLAKMFCLGTDFDGYIDPLNKYPTALEFSKLRTDLIAEIATDPNSPGYLFGLSDEVFVDNFCFNNAYEFAVKHFN